MTNFTIETFGDTRREQGKNLIQQTWGTPLQVSRDNLYNVLDYPGFIAFVDQKPQGMITYRIENGQCEVLILQSNVEGMGIGATLIDRVKTQAQETGCNRLWLITTNDNTHAFRWYQRCGFTIAAVHVNALEQSRKLKPEIPLFGNEGIPLRDEIEFEMLLA